MSFEIKEHNKPDNSVERSNSFDPDKRIDAQKAQQSSTVERFDPDKRVDIQKTGEKPQLNISGTETKPETFRDAKDKVEVTGGKYADVKRNSDSEKYEVHHMPAKSVSFLRETEGPAIRMEKSDHKLTASCGNSREAREYQAKQKELIDNGKFREAVQMDIDDIKSKFGDKYDKSIEQMKAYVDKLESEKRI